MIELKNVSKIYNVGGETLRALDKATLTIEDGEFVSIIGPSGSGKSTLMNIIGLLDTADEGVYKLDGQEVEKYKQSEITRIRSKKIGFVFQNFNLISNLSARENVELPLIYQKLRKLERDERVKKALERVGLIERQNHKPSELSGGQQQRVAVARALASHPSLILADEPTGNLDSETGKEIMEMFKELHAAGNTIILITHDDKIAKQADRVISIFDGKVREGAFEC